MATFTRQQYLNHECSHRQFYAQIVTDEVKATVLQRIGLSKLMASTDENLNDVSLRLWDALPATRAMSEATKATGDYLTLAGKVCIFKEAARQIIEAETAAQP